IQQERQNASNYLNKVFKKARRFMIREDIKLDVRAKAVLQEALSESNTLETVYQYKQKLKEIWARSTENQTKRVAKLQEWCAQAEQTGIKVLEDFAHALRGYSLQPA
ncbi:DesA/ISL3 alpha bundle tail domain-containing protein, partial [Kaarinaea lacus]